MTVWIWDSWTGVTITRGLGISDDANRRFRNPSCKMDVYEEFFGVNMTSDNGVECFE